MTRHSVNSLKSKILLATGALFLAICACGIGSWLVVSLFTENSLYVAFIQLLFSAAAIGVYGWWLSGEVTRPIEKVALLAKSLERGNSTSLPKTSGSLETDELLQTLHRNNQQLQNLVGLMDKVSGGNINVALTPLEQSDRLSNAFQKLLAKVTESINAKQDLDQLKNAVRQMNEIAGQIKSGDFDIEINSEDAATEDIADALRFLTRRLNELSERVQEEFGQTQSTARDVQKTVQSVVADGENRIREMQQASRALKQTPQAIKNISEELFASSHTARQSIERAQSGVRVAQQNLSAINQLRGQMREIVKRAGRLDEHAREIGRASQMTGDLAQRTNMIALNAVIQISEADRQPTGLNVFAEEIERLAERAAGVDRQISTLHKTFAAEIREVENSLQEAVGEAANLSRFAIETGNSLTEIEKFIAQFLHLQNKLVVAAGEQSADAEAAFETFASAIPETENAVSRLKESEARLARMAVLMKNLHFADADRDAPPVIAKESAALNELIADFEPEFYKQPVNEN